MPALVLSSLWGPSGSEEGAPGLGGTNLHDCKFLAEEWSRVRRLPVASSRPGKNVSLEMSWHARPWLRRWNKERRLHTQFRKRGVHLLLFGEMKEAVMSSPTSRRCVLSEEREKTRKQGFRYCTLSVCLSKGRSYLICWMRSLWFVSAPSYHSKPVSFFLSLKKVRNQATLILINLNGHQSRDISQNILICVL